MSRTRRGLIRFAPAIASFARVTSRVASQGIEVSVFEGDVNLSSLPASCCRVTLSTNHCCRNGALSTAVAGNLTAICEIDRCQTPCNSAPVFTNEAVALVCSNQDFIYNLGAIDPDGDSLSFAFGQALQGIGAPVTYLLPYSSTFQFNYFGAPNANAALPGGLHIDPITGNVAFRPQGSFCGNLVIEVIQWRLVGGVWTNVGMTRRDVQFQSVICSSNKSPIIKIYTNGILQTGLSYFVCAGKQICLDIAAQDQQDLTITPSILADTTDLKWNNPGLYSSVMSSATFTRNYILNQRGINGPKADSFKFCWTPPLNAARTLPHTFTVTASDRFCPFKALTTLGINITVVAVPMPSITVIDNKCSYRTFNFTLTNPTQTTLDSTKSKWYMETSPGSGIFTIANASPGFGNQSYKHYFPAAGNYKWKLALNSQLPTPTGCPSLDSGTVLYLEAVKVIVKDTFNCFGSAVTLKALASGGSRIGNLAGYQFFLGGLSSQTVIKGNLDPTVGSGITTDSFLTVTPSNIGNTTTYKVKIKDSNGCSDSTTFNILTKASPLRELTPKIRLCEGSDTVLFAGTNGSIPLQKTYWYKAPNLTLPIDTQSTLSFTKLKYSDSATIVLSKTNIFGCSILDTTKLFVNKPVSFISPKDSACTNDQKFALSARLNSMFIDSFVWYNLGTANRLLSNNTLLLPTSTIGTSFYKLRGYQTYDGITCFNDDTASLKIKGIPVVNLTNNIDSFCQGLVSILKATPNSLGHSFKWLKNNQIITNETNDSILVSDAFAYRAIISFGGCADTTISKNLTIYPKPIIGFSINNTKQCITNNIFNFTNTSSIISGSASYKWVLGQNDTSNSPNKSFNQTGNYQIQLIGLSDKNCKETLSKPVTVIANASANFTINNTSQCLNKNNFVFTNTSANSNTQNWSFGDATNSTVLSPTKTYANIGSYTVKLLTKNADNCNDSVTKTIVVNPEPIAVFSINNPSQCLNGNNFLYTDNSSITSGTINRLWLFSNGDTSTNASVNKSYFAVGTFGIKLTIKSDKNCLDTISKIVTVLPKILIGNILGNTNPTTTINPYSYSVLNQSNATYSWTTTNGTIQSGQGTNAVSVVWANAGVGSINAKITNANNCSDTTNLAVNLTKVGINNLSLDNDLKVYPNPTKTIITITNKTNLTGKKYNITNLVGQTVLSGKLNLDETIVNLESLQSGLYLLSIDGLNKQSIKVIKE
jgi:PKD repeat protein